MKKPAVELACRPDNAGPNWRNGASRKGRVALWGCVLLTLGGVVLGALTHLLPRPVDPALSFIDRAAWYFQHGQFGADLQTVASAVQYFVARDADFTNNPAAFTNLPVAGGLDPAVATQKS